METYRSVISSSLIQFNLLTIIFAILVIIPCMLIRLFSCAKYKKCSQENIDNNFFQERYKKYQEAMRAQDANRRRHPSSDTSRDNFSARPFSVGSSKPAPPLPPPPPPPRTMIQSASVCDLSAAHMWNPGMHQVFLLLTLPYLYTSDLLVIRRQCYIHTHHSLISIN